MFLYGLYALLQKVQTKPNVFESRCKDKQVYNINQIILQTFYGLVENLTFKYSYGAHKMPVFSYSFYFFVFRCL